ncbi:MAG TPA: M28 family peptidase [Desulfuromonadales bacterium]|nr:M28 family peptidase [Desulfuromonadales bacterium]
MSNLAVLAAALVAALAAAGYFMSRMPGTSFRGPLPSPTPAESHLAERLQNHVAILAERFGERHIWQFDNLQETAAYIETEFLQAGLDVRSISYRVENREVRNLEAEIRGKDRSEEVILVGAHYDTVPGTVGANDNGSGIAVLLELARHFSARQPSRTLRFVAFVNEEPPFFKTDRMGSRVYVEQGLHENEDIIGMLSLETIGYYSSEPGSQKFPLPLLRLFYPDRGDFLAMIGNLASLQLLKRSLQAFRHEVDFPSEGMAAPSWLAGVDWSDHGSFWKIGVPAIMVTDTALFRYPYYHDSGDTPDKLDYQAMARVTLGLQAVIDSLDRNL